jgi:ABC-type lipoprotein export system ATPase subunit
MIKTIQLNQLLPNVFDGLQHQSPVKDSDIWLRQVSFEKGNRYLVFAASGTGKSSLCSFVYGARRDFQGSLIFDGVDSSRLTIEQWSSIRRTSLAYLPQEMRLFPELTAMENIMIKNRLTDYCSESEIMAMLERLGVDNKADSPAARLSIGQQQRVAIVRALCQPFDFILLDEPVSHLDADNNKIAAQLITEHAQRQDAAIIATSVGYHLAIDSYKTYRL